MPGPAERLESIRISLAKVPPLQALAICYSRDPGWGSLRPPELASVVRECGMPPSGSRNKLLAWIYKDHRLYRDATYLRLPSASKQAVVREVLAGCKRRYPWLTSRLIHAFAFRPSWFERGKREKRKPNQAWDGLYRRVSIAKGPNKRRIIHIPVPPLRRLQKLLLKNCLDPALENELEPFVFGCRPGANYTVFHNAAQHIGQRFVARFDLKDFFPSIGIDDIVPALLSIRSPVLTRSTMSERPDGQTDIKRTHHPWTHDVAVPVARLATRRGRLPQGAPTSPAVANLVFRKYDREIVDTLGAELRLQPVCR